MASFVLRELSSLFEAVVAAATFEGFESRVDPQVILQVAALVELPLADTTD